MPVTASKIKSLREDFSKPSQKIKQKVEEINADKEFAKFVEEYRPDIGADL